MSPKTQLVQYARTIGVRVTSEQIEAAALAKYTYRASAEYTKDEAHELSLIEAAVSR